MYPQKAFYAKELDGKKNDGRDNSKFMDTLAEKFWN